VEEKFGFGDDDDEAGGGYGDGGDADGVDAAGASTSATGDHGRAPSPRWLRRSWKLVLFRQTGGPSHLLRPSAYSFCEIHSTRSTA
jgi:hypothetical protein